MYVPDGWYVDLTELLNTAGFRRIPAHANWEKWDIGSEWWHYQYDADLQPTFLDECELIGISEKRLEKARYTVEEMDRRPA